MYKYFLIGADGKELPAGDTRDSARVSKRYEEGEYLKFWLDEPEPNNLDRPLVQPIKIVRRKYEMVEEKVVR